MCLKLHDEISDEFSRAHVILRIGYADPVVNYNPRRDVQSFIETADDKAYLSQKASNDQSAGKGRGVLGVFGKIFGAK